MSFVNSNIIYLESKFLNEHQSELSDSFFMRPVSPVRTLRNVSPVRPSSPVRNRARSPNRTNKKTQTVFINNYHVSEIAVPDFSTEKYYRVSSKELEEVYKVQHNLDNNYEVLDFYINTSNTTPEQLSTKQYQNLTVIFMVRYYFLDVKQIISNIQEQFSKYSDVINTSNITIFNSNNRFVNPEVTKNYSFRVNVTLNWKLLEILGKNVISFDTSINRLQSTTKYFFEAFRTICRSEPILNDMFLEIVRQFQEETRNNIGLVIEKSFNK